MQSLALKHDHGASFTRSCWSLELAEKIK